MFCSTRASARFTVQSVVGVPQKRKKGQGKRLWSRGSADSATWEEGAQLGERVGYGGKMMKWQPSRQGGCKQGEGTRRLQQSREKMGEEKKGERRRSWLALLGEDFWTAFHAGFHIGCFPAKMQWNKLRLCSQADLHSNPAHWVLVCVFKYIPSTLISWLLTTIEKL